MSASNLNNQIILYSLWWNIVYSWESLCLFQDKHQSLPHYVCLILYRDPRLLFRNHTTPPLTLSSSPRESSIFDEHLLPPRSISSHWQSSPVIEEHLLVFFLTYNSLQHDLYLKMLCTFSKQICTQSWWKTQRPPPPSFQLFNSWYLNFFVSLK